MASASTNRWDLLDPPQQGNWSPRHRASVVISYFDALPALRRTLIGVTAQTYPAELTEIVIVDDGSAKPLLASDIEDLGEASIVRREDEGYTLAAARNAGAWVATGRVLVFLDCDMIPDPAWLESHMRWHHVHDRALVLGLRDHLDDQWLTEEVVSRAIAAGGLGTATSGRTVERPEWIEFHLARTSDLTSADDDLFRIVTGGNLSMPKSLLEEIDGYDESFTRWGGEDTELGYRAWISGALLIPERGAHCWHQGLGTLPDPAEADAQRAQRSKLAHLIPQASFRPIVPGRTWQRPRIVAAVGPGSIDDVVGTTTSLLGCTDLEVVIQSADDPQLREEFGPEPRVHLGIEPETVSPFSPLRCRVPAGLVCEPGLVSELADRALRMGRAVSDDGIEMISVRHRAREHTQLARIGRKTLRVTPPSTISRIADRAKRIRSWSDALAAARWLAEAARRRWLHATARKRSANGAMTPPSSPAGLTVDPWARVLAPDHPALPASGRPGDRLDLIVIGQEYRGSASVPTIVLGGHPDEDLLAYPPLEPTHALAVIRGEAEPQLSAAIMLRGEAPAEPPPGARTRAAWELLLQHDKNADEAMIEAVRRAVLSEHLSPVRLDQLREAAGLPTLLPRVSVVLCTRRIHLARGVVGQMTRQTYPDREIIVVGHGADPSSLTPLLESESPRYQLVSVSGEVPFGAALAFGSREASGDLIAKVDDDDLYSATHIEDLVNAWLLSRADLVGKAAEFVWLQEQGMVIRRFTGGAYSDSQTIAGGALAVTRDAYDAIGGWRPTHRHVDRALIEDLTARNGSVFRTHGLGYVLVRHGDHTWHSGDRRFLDQAEEKWDELPPWVLGGVVNPVE